MERGDSKVPLGIAPPLVACACSEIKCPNMPGVRASVFHSKPSVVVGPVLVHYRKTFATYLHFLSTLIGLRRELANVQCFGTDGEIALLMLINKLSH